MNEKELQKLLKDLDRVPERYKSDTQRAFENVVNKVIADLQDLKTTDGQIRVTLDNLAKVRQLRQVIIDYIEREFEQLNNRVFNKLDQNFERYIKAINATDLTIPKENTAKEVSKQIVDASRLDVNEYLRKQIYDNVLRAATGGSDLRASIQGLKNLTSEPRIANRTGILIYDGFTTAIRTQNKIINDIIKPSKYRYVGGLVEDSRSFCKERNGKTFTVKEIEAWADEDWQGKKDGTNEETIFTFCGGYNCNHILIPTL
jgi:hypothetical protein